MLFRVKPDASMPATMVRPAQVQATESLSTEACSKPAAPPAAPGRAPPARSETPPPAKPSAASNGHSTATAPAAALPLRDAVRALKIRLVREALVASGGNKAEAARSLGICTTHLYRQWPFLLARPAPAEVKLQNLHEAVRALRRQLSRAALAAAGGDRRSAAESLGISPEYLRVLLNDHGPKAQ